MQDPVGALERIGLQGCCQGGGCPSPSERGVELGSDVLALLQAMLQVERNDVELLGERDDLVARLTSGLPVAKFSECVVQSRIGQAGAGQSHTDDRNYRTPTRDAAGLGQGPEQVWQDASEGRSRHQVSEPDRRWTLRRIHKRYPKSIGMCNVRFGTIWRSRRGQAVG
ncbi:MAG: hypothetical protein JWP07_837, partial [Pseudonocardiales bacterium]|nr:hypothetical protein [Pseudonocardiales bacterium]